ncbi:MAG: cation:dicarboxylase symporter family transporter [Lachnospiraceae bacterium]|nr:cation:dicarboxylase symporter family transporter [Candidatus Minthocola equi]
MGKYKLTNDTIDLLSEKIGEMYKGLGCAKKETFRAKLLLEEALLKYQSRFGEDIEVSYRVYKVIGQTRFGVRIEAPSFDPFTLEENPMAFMVKSIMGNFDDTAPTWQYKNLENQVVFSVHKKAKLGMLSRIGIALAVSCILAVIARLLLPHEVLNTIVTDYLQPLSDAYAGSFCVMAVLLTLFAIALGIVRIGDASSVGQVGGRILGQFAISLGIVSVVFALMSLPFVQIGDAGSISFAGKTIYDIFVGFIPTNIVTPFINFNSVHIMILGAMFGFSLLAMGQKGETLVKIFDECNQVALLTNNFLNKFIMIYVAIKAFEMISVSEVAQFAGAGKVVIAILIAELLIFVFYTLHSSSKADIPVREYVRKMMPAFIVCLSSANFGAAFSTVCDTVASAKALNEKTIMMINLGSVLFQPASTAMCVISSFIIANEYGVEISIAWMIIAVILSVILVASMPNIPGAAISVITLLYAQLGLPSEAVAMMIALNALLQFPTIAVDAWCLQGECINLYVATEGMNEE